jgi:hypothetical protein
MRSVAFALGLALMAPVAAVAQPGENPRELRFSGAAALNALCSDLLDASRRAEAEGRLDFTAEVESSGSEVTARIRMGPAYSVGRINFAGHSRINDTTLRRAMTIYERDDFDVGQLRRSLTRINGLGVFEPLTLTDISVARRADGVTADLTIALRERKRRWWSVSGPTLPGIGLLQASVASRLPPWGRGVFEAATYFVSLNITGFAKPFLALERPVVPGQELFSGFAISPALSPRSMVSRYGRTHLAHAIGGKLNGDVRDALAVPVISAGHIEDEPLICKPPTPPLQWLRRGAATAVNIALAALLP